MDLDRVANDAAQQAAAKLVKKKETNHELNNKDHLQSKDGEERNAVLNNPTSGNKKGKQMANAVGSVITQYLQK